MNVPCIRRRGKAVKGQLLHAARVLDQAWIVEWKAAAQFTLKDRLQLAVIHLAVRTDGVLQFLWGDVRGFAWREVNRARGKVDAKGDQARDHIKQQAHGIEHRNHRVDLAVDLPATVREENTAAGSQLSEQGGNHNATYHARRHTHLKTS
ncbi:hypothetical protein AA042_06640 [Pseudomonas lundensis]|nr:hypothetical protein AA042_06640 [Pseudomonas lundensis]